GLVRQEDGRRFVEIQRKLDHAEMRKSFTAFAREQIGKGKVFGIILRIGESRRPDAVVLENSGITELFELPRFVADAGVEFAIVSLERSQSEFRIRKKGAHRNGVGKLASHSCDRFGGKGTESAPNDHSRGDCTENRREITRAGEGRLIFEESQIEIANATRER